MTVERRREGFILLAVLWIIAGVVSMAALVALAGRADVGVAQNRLDLERARWRAEGCLERAHAAADSGLRAAERPDDMWQGLDSAIVHSALVAGCHIRLAVVGARRDVNSVDEAELRRLFTVLGYPPATSDSLADAVLDWRDEDQATRPRGAEREWYAAHQRIVPRDGPFASAKELHLVRGLENDIRLDSLFDTEGARLVLGHADPRSLSALPGITPEAVVIVSRRRADGDRAIQLASLLNELSAPARAEAMAHYRDLSLQVADRSDAWLLTDEEAIGAPPVVATIEERLILDTRKVAVTRRRGMP